MKTDPSTAQTWWKCWVEDFRYILERICSLSCCQERVKSADASQMLVGLFVCQFFRCCPSPLWNAVTKSHTEDTIHIRSALDKRKSFLGHIRVICGTERTHTYTHLLNHLLLVPVVVWHYLNQTFQEGQHGSLQPFVHAVVMLLVVFTWVNVQIP